MKANQSFKQNDEAVSPVIGVILMVAITVVLAAVVFVLVGNLTETSDDAPQITFIKNTGAGTLTVQTVSYAQALTWNGTTDNSINVSGCGSGDTAGESVDAGDILGSCSGQVTVTHVGTNSLVYTTTF